MTLKIPSQFIAAARSFLALPKADRDRIAAAFRESQRPKTTAAFVEGIMAVVPDHAAAVRGLVRMLISLQLFGLDRDLAASKLAEAFRDAAQAQALSPTEPSDAGYWADLTAQLTEVFSASQSLGLVAKSVDVLRENERLFTDARVLTDLRPVFDEDPATGPLASVILHTLRLDCVGEPRTFHVVLDAHDLRRLRDVLDRALKKESAVLQMGERFNLPVLGYPLPEEQEDAGA